MSSASVKELDELDLWCAREIMGWKVFKGKNISTYEPVGIAVDAFRPTRWVLDAFKLVDKIPQTEATFSLLRDSDGWYTATFSSRSNTKKVVSKSPAYAITVSALHYVMERGGASGKPEVLKTGYKR